MFTGKTGLLIKKAIVPTQTKCTQRSDTNSQETYRLSSNDGDSLFHWHSCSSSKVYSDEHIHRSYIYSSG